MEVSKKGSKRWFWRFWFNRKESRMALGSYPDVSLKAARMARDEARKTKHSGTNPVHQRLADKATKATSNANTFEAVARDFHLTKAPGWTPAHAKLWLRCVEKDLFPWFGSLPLTDVSAPVLLKSLKLVEARGSTQMARDLCEFAGQVFMHGIATGRCNSNPAAGLTKALKPHLVKHMAAVVEPLEVGALMRCIDDYRGQPATRAALVLSALVFQRPVNIRKMEWAEIDEAAALWTIPSDKMKRTMEAKLNGRPHLVPLAPQALAILADIRPLTGHGRYVFPSTIGGQRPMSDNTITAALRRMDYSNKEMCAHGFRAMARTLIAERLPSIPIDAVEAQLAHGKSGPLGMAYDRAEFMEQRRTMMTVYADYLDTLRAGAVILPFKAA